MNAHRDKPDRRRQNAVLVLALVSAACELVDAIGRIAAWWWTEMYLSRRLAGRVPLGTDDLFAIASALGMPVSALLDLAQSATEPRTAAADGAPGVATGRVELPTFRFSVERSTN